MRRRERPRVVAHRGSSRLRAEHTLGAYVAALDEGADGLECDVRLTADGHLVCVHDRRVERTTNGRGIVSTMELAELHELDFASWKNPWVELDDEAPELDLESRKVLTLERLVQAVSDYDRPVELAIETKHPTRYGGLVERQLVDLLKAHGWTKKGAPVRAMSFSYVALNRLKRLAPDLEVVMLVDRLYSWQLTRNLVGTDWLAGPGIELLRENPRFRTRLAKSGRPIHVWVVNSHEDIDLCLELGAEAIITDTPAETLQYLRDHG